MTISFLVLYWSLRFSNYFQSEQLDFALFHYDFEKLLQQFARLLLFICVYKP